MSANFWQHLVSLVELSEFIVDRAQGSPHPRYPESVYPLDYGHLAGTSASDASEIDVWRGSRDDARVDAVLCTVDLVKRDAEVKVLLGCTPADQESILAFHRSQGMGALLIPREAS